MYFKQLIRSVGPQQATEQVGWLRNDSPDNLSSAQLSSKSWAVCRSCRVTVLAGFRLDRKLPYPNDLHQNDADEANGPGLKRLIGVEKNKKIKVS